ncbi:MAG: nitroreductase family protein [Deltaproteobacteria bacterium]
MTQINNKHRNPEYEVSEIFPARWSERAMSGESISANELMSLVEAARWSPSAFNNQPWRFLYALRDTASWDLFFDLLADANKAWVKNAAALVAIVAKKTFDHNGKPSRTHAFDAGAAWMSFALQGSLAGLVVHGMEGFDYDRARGALDVPDGYEIQAMAAVGRRGKIGDLPERLRERELPSGRKNLSDIAFEGKFPK